MNLVQINERLKDLPMQVLQQYANGMNPEVPPYLALGELQRREMSQKQAATAQGAAQGPQPSVKEQVEQKAGLMAAQALQQQQAMQQMQQRPMPGPIPEGTPQPQMQPQPEMMARGGLAGIPVRRDMFEYAGGGIIAFQSGGDVAEKYERETAEMGEGKRMQFSPDVQAYAKQLRAAANAEQEGFAERERQRMLSQSREVAPEREAAMAGPNVTEQTMRRVGPMTAPKFADPRMAMAQPEEPAGLPAALQKAAPDAAPRPSPMAGAPMPGAPRPAPAQAGAPAAPQTGLPAALAGAPAAAQSVNPYEARLNQVALKEPVAPTAQDAINRIRELSPEAMQEEFMKKRMQEQRDRAASERAAFEKSRPSGLDDLIRVLGQAGQYKGFSGIGPAYTANQQQRRAEELAMEKRQNELLNAVDAGEYERSKALFTARTGAFDTAQQLFGKEKDNVVKATASLYETTQSRINNEMKMLSDKEIQQLKMDQETKIEGAKLGMRAKELASLERRDPNAKIAEYVGLKAKARELREKGGAENIKQADRLLAQAADMMEYGGKGLGAGGGAKPMTRDQASDNVSKKLDFTNPNRKQTVADATQSLRSMGIANPTLAQIEEHLIQEQMKGVSLEPTSGPSGKVPAVGTVMDGYRFKGGNPANQSNWEKV